MKKFIHELTELIYDDMKPALGVTEPGAIAFAVAKARSYTKGKLARIKVTMNSGMYKNAFTCGIPGSEKTGAVYAAAFGYVAGDPDKGLQSLEGMTASENEEGKRLAAEGKITIEISGITSRIFIQAEVKTEDNTATVTIKDAHTNIACISVDGKTVYGAKEAEVPDTEPAGHEAEKPDDLTIHKYTLEQLVEYADAVDLKEISFIEEAFTMNLRLLHEGLESGKTPFAERLLELNAGSVISDDELKTSQLLCSGAIEARVTGCDAPAMSITGSGAHGIIATMPLYSAYKAGGFTKEKLLRAAALSFLICIFIKEYSGKLSAFCGCGIAAGTGMACALCYIKGGGIDAVNMTLNNMAASITGMICDGGNHGCTMKSIAAVDTAYRSVDFALNGICIKSVHSIIGRSAELTMRNIGLIASPGMTGTEKTIVEIFEEKGRMDDEQKNQFL